MEITGNIFVLFQCLATLQKETLLVLVLGVTWGSNILDLSLCFFSGEKQVVERCW